MKLRRIALLAAPFALTAALAFAGPAVQAQAPQATVQSQTPEPAPAGPAAEEGHAGHHPEVKLFGKSLGTLAQFGISVFNFVLFAGLLLVLLKGALASAFKARTKDLEEKLSQAEREKTEAEGQVQELETRMAGLQQELAGIMAKAEAEADLEKRRILESAQAEAAQIRLQTRADIDAQKRQAEAELRALVADLVVTEAARRVQSRVQGEVAAGVLDRSIEQVGGAE